MFILCRYQYTFSLLFPSLCLAELYIFNSFNIPLLISASSPFIVLELSFEPHPAGFHKRRNEEPRTRCSVPRAVSPKGNCSCLFSECSTPDHKSLIFCHIITETNVLFSALTPLLVGITPCFIPPTKHLCFRSLFFRCNTNSMQESEEYGDPALPRWLCDSWHATPNYSPK